MASTFKTLLNNDVVNTRTLLHEAIPVTGTISSGTYQNTPGTELNIKTFSHGMFQSVYDYPFLSSSANHIFDVSYGYSSAASASANTQNSKKLNIYNQMAQVLMGYNESGSIRKFDSDGTLDDDTGIMNQCFFINFSRLLSKDEVKKNSFRFGLYLSGSGDGDVRPAARKTLTTIGDYLSANQYRTSPAGDYGLLFTGSSVVADQTAQSVGLIFYQAGIVVLSSSIFLGQFGTPTSIIAGQGKPAENNAEATHVAGTGVRMASTGSTIDTLAGGLRHRIHDIDFNNTIELNSTIYFCRANHNEFNYSSNPTYVTGSKLVIKNNVNDLPVSYMTTVGLYSADNEMLAVAKLSEPIRKDPNTELTLRVRLDY